jgi:hypothetical protein
MQQTTKVSTATIFIPGGSRVEVQESGAGAYTDMGSVDGDVSIALEWSDVKLQDNSARVIKTYKKDMKMTGSVTLMDTDPANIVRVSGGVITSTSTASTAHSSIPVQVIPIGWAQNTLYDLNMKTSATDSTLLKMGTTKPTITSIEIDADGTPETLAEHTDYMLVKANCESGWAIQFDITSISKPSPTTYAITITYGTNTPIASTTLYCGSSTATFSAYKMRFSCNDSTGKARKLELFSVTTNSGGIAFGLKSALSDGTDTLPLNFTGEIDTTLTDGRQLFAWTVDTGVV